MHRNESIDRRDSATRGVDRRAMGGKKKKNDVDASQSTLTSFFGDVVKRKDASAVRRFPASPEREKIGPDAAPLEKRKFQTKAAAAPAAKKVKVMNVARGAAVMSGVAGLTSQQPVVGSTSRAASTSAAVAVSRSAAVEMTVSTTVSATTVDAASFQAMFKHLPAKSSVSRKLLKEMDDSARKYLSKAETAEMKAAFVLVQRQLLNDVTSLRKKYSEAEDLLLTIMRKVGFKNGCIAKVTSRSKESIKHRLQYICPPSQDAEPTVKLPDEFLEDVFNEMTRNLSKSKTFSKSDPENEVKVKQGEGTRERMPTVKTCSICNTRRPLSAFAFSPGRKDDNKFKEFRSIWMQRDANETVIALDPELVARSCVSCRWRSRNGLNAWFATNVVKPVLKMLDCAENGAECCGRLEVDHGQADGQAAKMFNPGEHRKPTLSIAELEKIFSPASNGDVICSLHHRLRTWSSASSLKSTMTSKIKAAACRMTCTSCKRQFSQAFALDFAHWQRGVKTVKNVNELVNVLTRTPPRVEGKKFAFSDELLDLLANWTVENHPEFANGRFLCVDCHVQETLEENAEFDNQLQSLSGCTKPAPTVPSADVVTKVNGALATIAAQIAGANGNRHAMRAVVHRALVPGGALHALSEVVEASKKVIVTQK